MNDGKKKKSQKHKNRTAFKITFDTQALQQQRKVSLNNLCVRCTQQIEWKLQYNKYKKMTEPARCNFCEQKNVFRTYMKACQQCVVAKNVCAKCLASDYEQPQEVKVLEKDQKKQQKTTYNKQIDFMKTLQQRSRRTIRRGLEKGKISWDNEQQYFIDEEGNKMIGLHFRKGFAIDEDGDDQHSEDIMDEDDDMFGDDEDLQGDQNNEEDQENHNKPKKSATTNQKEDKKKVHNDNKEEKKQEDKENQNCSKKNDDDQKDEQDNSDIEGDEVDCENDLDLEDEIGDDDVQLDDEEEEEQQQDRNTKKNNKKK